MSNGTDSPQEDTMGVFGADDKKHHLFRTRAEEDEAVRRSPLKVTTDLLALAERVGAFMRFSRSKKSEE